MNEELKENIAEIIEERLDRVHKWDKRFLKLAYEVSTWSKDPSTKVGAVIVAPDLSIVSVGYNGFPRKVRDTTLRLNTRELKYKIIIHGEINALITAQRSVEGCTLYTVPFMPCSTCASIFIQAGIDTIVTPHNDNKRWAESFKLTRELCEEAAVKLVELPESELIDITPKVEEISNG